MSICVESRPNGRHLLFALLAGVLLSVVQQFVTDLFSACADDPDDVIKMITSNGFSAEVHNATTRDGYVLTIHRMSQGKNNGVSTRQVVLLMHCVMCSSINWLMNNRNNTLAYLLADAGFDVWIANVRGNTYSQVHTNYTSEDKNFWDFSWQEHALLDLPATMHYILRETGEQQLYYVGHSQGTTLAFAAFSADQKLASKVKHVYALAPIIDLNHTRGFLWLMSKTITPLRLIINSTITRYGEFMSADGVFNRLSSVFCSTMISRAFCAQAILHFTGGTRENWNTTKLPIYIRHTPAATSVKNMHHWSQLTHSDICKYDYESKTINKLHYGQPHPPCFNMSDYKVPTTLYSGGRDLIATRKQVTRVVEQLKHVVTLHKHIPHYGHVDFIWGMDAATQLYKDIIKHMKTTI